MYAMPSDLLEGLVSLSRRVDAIRTVLSRGCLRAALGTKSVQRGLGAITLLREVCLKRYLPRLAWSLGPSSLTPSKLSHV